VIAIEKGVQHGPIARRSEALAEACTTQVNLNLRSLAFENHHALVFHAWFNLSDGERRKTMRDPYVFFSVCCQCGGYIGDLAKQDIEKAKGFVTWFMTIIAWLEQERAALSEEWFRGIEQLTGALTDRYYIQEARQAVAIGLRTGVAKFPRVAQSLAVHAAYLDALAGRGDKAAKVALRLVQRPYLLPDRRDLPRVYQRMLFILAAENHLKEYRSVLWKGVSSFHVNGALRDMFVAQIVKTYRGMARAFVDRDIPWIFRFPFLVAWLAQVIRAFRPFAVVRADAPLRGLHRACLYALDAIGFLKPAMFERMARRPQNNPQSMGDPSFAANSSRTKRILVTRAMGGLGDLLMMTPGLKALSMRYPKAEIDFAIPKSFHPTFDEFRAVRLLDINEDEIDLSRYHRWINLTHCPAGRVESKQYPNVRTNRVEIFARAMGISQWRLRRTAGFKPFYTVQPDERVWAQVYLQRINPNGRPVVGVQPFAADTYRNWPLMEECVRRLSSDHLVLLFHHEDVHGFDFDYVVKVKETFRRCAALVEQCSRLVVVDSSFLHLSAALDIPTVAVFVAISGSVRTRRYPNVRLCVPNKKEYPCYPCWRHEHKPCHLTNARESICARSITVEQVIAALNTDLAHWRVKTSLWTRFKAWMLYGRD
jgi:ADP-heptose:LPS heptosyltransferase